MLRPFQPVVPVAVPVWKDVCIPNFLDAVLVVIGAVERFLGFTEVLSFLNEESSDVVDPLCSSF
mgnify:FL=1